MLCCFTACNNDNNDYNISITNLEAGFSASDEKFKFTISEKSDGFSFEYIDNIFGTEVTYSGSADKKQNITNFTIIYKDISTETLYSVSKMNTALSHLIQDPDSLTINEMVATGCLFDLMQLYYTIGVDDDVTIATILDNIHENKTTEMNGWSVSVKTSGSTVTFTMNK